MLVKTLLCLHCGLLLHGNRVLAPELTVKEHLQLGLSLAYFRILANSTGPV